jgi:hypothetical protein
VVLAFNVEDFSSLKKKLIFQEEVVYACFQILMCNPKFRVLLFSNPIKCATKIIKSLEKDSIENKSKNSD